VHPGSKGFARRLGFLLTCGNLLPAAEKINTSGRTATGKIRKRGKDI
jgi:hypothetical protein